MDRVTRTKYLANTYKYFGLHERREDVYDNVDGCRVVKFQSGSFSLSLSVYIYICIWRERRESWAERELSELTIESDGANRDALAGPPFNEINHNGAEGTTQSIRYAATSRVATKNTTRIHAPAYRGHVSTGCCSDHWGAIVFTTCIQGGNSDLCFKSFSPFFFFLLRDLLDSLISSIPSWNIFRRRESGCCTVSFFMGIIRKFHQCLLITFWKEFGIFFTLR